MAAESCSIAELAASEAASKTVFRRMGSCGSDIECRDQPVSEGVRAAVRRVADVTTAELALGQAADRNRAAPAHQQVEEPT
jgi:hypothetical protein